MGYAPPALCQSWFSQSWLSRGLVKPINFPFQWSVVWSVEINSYYCLEIWSNSFTLILVNIIFAPPVTGYLAKTVFESFTFRSWARNKSVAALDLDIFNDHIWDKCLDGAWTSSWSRPSFLWSNHSSIFEWPANRLKCMNVLLVSIDILLSTARKCGPSHSKVNLAFIVLITYQWYHLDDINE